MPRYSAHRIEIFRKRKTKEARIERDFAVRFVNSRWFVSAPALVPEPDRVQRLGPGFLLHARAPLPELFLQVIAQNPQHDFDSQLIQKLFEGLAIRRRTAKVLHLRRCC